MLQAATPGLTAAMNPAVKAVEAAQDVRAPCPSRPVRAFRAALRRRARRRWHPCPPRRDGTSRVCRCAVDAALRCYRSISLVAPLPWARGINNVQQGDAQGLVEELTYSLRLAQLVRHDRLDVLGGVALGRHDQLVPPCRAQQAAGTCGQLRSVHVCLAAARLTCSDCSAGRPRLSACMVWTSCATRCASTCVRSKRIKPGWRQPCPSALRYPCCEVASNSRRTLLHTDEFRSTASRVDCTAGSRSRWHSHCDRRAQSSSWLVSSSRANCSQAVHPAQPAAGR